MRKAPTSVFLGSVIVAALFFGCARESSVAVTKSNQAAKRLYHVEPFKEEHGQWRSEGQQQIWDALTSSGGHDFTAKVIFDQRGSAVSVDVRMLADPTSEPAKKLDLVPGHLVPGPDRQEKKLGIPEVMPK